MNRTKVQADDLFFFDNKGDTAPIRRNLESGDELANEIGELILSSSDEDSECSDSICSLNDSYDSDDDSSSSYDGDTESSEEEEEEKEEQEHIPLILPEHSCVYCNIFNPYVWPSVSNAPSGSAMVKRGQFLVI